MGKGKGFQRPKPILGKTVPGERLEKIATTVPRLEQLLTEIMERRLTPRCYGLIKKLAYIPPAIRLAMNLKTLLGLMCQHDIQSVLTDGLGGDERDVLIEIDASGMSLGSRRTAHALFDIEQRIKLVDGLGGMFRDCCL